jgi:WD40 repeat protein
MESAASALEGLAPADRAVVEEALRLSASALERDPALLASQLVGRLAGHPAPAIRALVDRLRPQASLCPASASLESPGSPLRRTLSHHSDFVGGLVFLPGGKLVSSSEDSSLAVWDLAAGDSPVLVLSHDMPVNWLAVSPNGRRIAGACDDGKIYVYETESWGRVRVLKGHTEYVRQVAFTKSRVISTSNDNTVRIWDRESGKELKRFSWDQTTQGIAVSPGGRYALVSSLGNVMKIYDLNKRKVAKTLVDMGKNFIGDVGGFGFLNADNTSGVGHQDYCKRAVWTPDGSRILSVEKELITWDAKSGKQLSVVSEWAWGWEAMEITKDGRHVVLAGRQIEIRELDGNRVATLTGFEEANSVALHPDGDLFATGHRDGSIRVWSLSAALARGVVPGHAETVYVCDFSRDGRTGITTASDGLVKLWDLATGAEVRTLAEHKDPFVEVIATLPDGRRLVTTDHAGVLLVWDMATGQRLVRATRGEEKLYSFRSMVLLDGGKKALAGQVLEGLTIWDLEADGTAVELEGDAYGVYGLHVTKDESRAYTCGYADDEKVGAIGIWDLVAKKKLGEIPNTPKKKGVYFDSMLLLPGERTALTADSECRLEVWDLDGKKRLRELQGPRSEKDEGWMPKLLPLPDGTFLTAQHHPSGAESRITAWSVETGESRVLVKFPGTYREVSVHAGTRRLLVANGPLHLYDLDTGRLLATFAGDHDVFQAAFSQDGRTILAGEQNGRVHVLRVQV